MSILENPWELCDALNFKGGRINFSQIQFELMEELIYPQMGSYKNPSKLVKISRGHLKTTCLVLYILWRIYRNPNIRIMYAADSMSLSNAVIRELRQYFESHELQDKVWNNREHIEGNLVPAIDIHGRRKRRDSDTEAQDRKIIWTTSAIQVVRPKFLKEATVVAASVGSTNTGEHYDLVVCDDIVDFQNSDTEAKAEKIYNWVMDLISVLDPPVYDTVTEDFGEYIGDCMYVTGTPYYPWDYYAMIAKNFETLKFTIFEANIYINGENSDDGYTYPEKFNDVYVESVQSRMTRKRFFAQYLLKHISEDDVVLDETCLVQIPPSLININGDGTATILYGGGKKDIKLHMVVDPHSGKKVGVVDNTAIAVGGQDDEMNLFVLYLQAKRTTTSETVKAIYETSNKFSINICNVLIRGVGELLPHAIQRERYVYDKTLMIKPVSETGDKKSRITNALQPLVAMGKLITVSWIALNTPLINEMRLHPEGKQDDCLDAITGLSTISKPTKQKKQIRGIDTSCQHIQVNKKYGGSQ